MAILREIDDMWRLGDNLPTVLLANQWVTFVGCQLTTLSFVANIQA